MYVEESLEEIRVNNKIGSIPVTTIYVQFEPVPGSPNSNNQMSVDLKVYSRKKAITLFKDMVRQIREQQPDALYLAQIAETFLTGAIEDDASPDEICRVGTPARASKKLLSKPKRGNRRRRK